jgi:ADP-ribose pyrophosphatase
MSISSVPPFAQIVIALAGISLVYLQFKHRRKEWQLELAKWLHSQVGKKEFRDALRTIYSSPQFELDGTPSKELYAAISIVAGQFDLLGSAVKQGVFPKDAVLVTEWKVLVPLWKKLEKFVDNERKHRGIEGYKEYFEWLAKEAWTYATQNGFNPEEINQVGPRDAGPKHLGPCDSPGRHLVYSGRHLQLYDECYGAGKHWEYVYRTKATGGVTIVAIDGQERILFVEQFRRPLRKLVIEFPAGLVGDELAGETAEDAAKRELKEETKVDCTSVSILSGGPLLPGITDEVNTFCLAEVALFPETIDGLFKLNVQGNSSEQDEFIPVVYAVPLSRVISWLEKKRTEGKEIDLRIYAGLYLVELEKKRRGQPCPPLP